jgi:hypothetical protein
MWELLTPDYRPDRPAALGQILRNALMLPPAKNGHSDGSTKEVAAVA